MRTLGSEVVRDRWGQASDRSQPDAVANGRGRCWTRVLYGARRAGWHRCPTVRPGYDTPRVSTPPPTPSSSRLRRHRMTLADWNDLWAMQGGKCYLCHNALPSNVRNVHVDHEHLCCGPVRSCKMCLRGLACNRCNWIIGLAEEDIEILKRIAIYLETSQGQGGTPWRYWPGTPWRMLCVDRYYGTQSKWAATP